jgi:hypothetical protein
MVLNFTRGFDQAHVPVHVLDGPIQWVDRDIFQMDIVRDRAERIRVWPGGEGNTVAVLDARADLQQLVLLVHEQRRPFVVKLPKSLHTREDARRIAGGDRFCESDTQWFVVRHTDPVPRRFLCGRDETHLFIAQVGGGDTVDAARHALKPADVRDAETRGIPVRRQGEWFFIEAERERQKRVNRMLRITQAARRDVPLRQAARPHVVEFMVRVPGETACVRGAVRHPDHNTLTLVTWHRFVLNAEVRSADRARGVYWVD